MGRGFQFAAAARLAGCPREEKPRRRWTFATLVFGFCSFWSWQSLTCSFGLGWSSTFVPLVFGLGWSLTFVTLVLSNLNFFNQLDFRAEGESGPSKTLQPN